MLKNLFNIFQPSNEDEKEILNYFTKKSKQALIRGDFWPALRYLDRALEIKPGSLKIFLAKGIIYKEGLKNIEKAMECLKKAATMPSSGDQDDEITRERAKQAIKTIMEEYGDSYEK